MPKTIVSYPENCTGCRMCEMMCSLFHEGQINPVMARIQIYKDGLETDFPVTCTLCGDCIERCPEAAISDEEGIIDVDIEKCIACGTCVDTCKYNAIRLSQENSDSEGKAFKCDLCGGAPECVKVCTPEAIKFEDITEERKKMMQDFLVELENSYRSKGGE